MSVEDYQLFIIFSLLSRLDASIRNFGFLVSKKPYIYTIDDDCLPAKDKDGNTVNPIALHLQNLMAPANPYFFNTLYDPFATNSDFVRGYP
jgi:reversibly glycosylated polypeptide/UDP-arabinopyranose mutase